MAVRWCPHCNLPLTPEEARQGVCPGCGRSPGKKPRRSPASNRLGSRVGKIALGVSLLVGLFAFLGLRSRLKSGARKPIEEISHADPVLVPPRPSTMAQTTSPPAATYASAPLTAAPAAPASDGFEHLDLPDDDRVFKTLGGGEIVKLAGRVRALKVGSVGGNSLLDASRLVARQIVFTGPIDGASTVKLCAPSGIVEFCSTISDRSHLEIDAPGGQIAFGLLGGNSKVVRIKGESDLRLVAREIIIRGRVAGDRTHLAITLTPGGHLRMCDLTGGCLVQWRKSAATDPEPRLERGALLAGAIIKNFQ